MIGQEEIYIPKPEEVVRIEEYSRAVAMGNRKFLVLFGIKDNPDYFLNHYKNGTPVDKEYQHRIMIVLRDSCQRINGEIVQYGINVLPAEYEFVYPWQPFSVEKKIKLLTIPVPKKFISLDEFEFYQKNSIEYVHESDKPDDFPVGHIVNIEDATPYQHKYYRPIRLKK